MSIGFLRQENWSGLPFSFLGDLPDPRIKATSPALAGGFFFFFFKFLKFICTGFLLLLSRLLTVVASLVPEHRLWALGLSSHGTQALVALRHVGSSQIRG